MEYPRELEGKIGFSDMVELPKCPWHRGTVLLSNDVKYYLYYFLISYFILLINFN